jgi:hypothetical protein
MKFLDRLHPYRFQLTSLFLAALAYGLVIPWLGLYWDDWPLVWYAHHLGPEAYQNFAAYRPVSGWIYYFSFLSFGDNVLAWHAFALLWRWLCTLAFWWLLRLLWPRAGRLATVISLLFLLYPGFGQQSISVTYSVYFIYYSGYLTSLCLMIMGLRAQRRTPYILSSIVLGLLTMFSTEYFYGLELLRPFVLWLAMPNQSSRQRLAKALRAWLPYAPMVPIVFAWRYWATQQEEALYGAGLLTALAADPLRATGEWLVTAATDIFEAGAQAWLRVGEVWGQLASGSRVSLLYFPVAIAAAACAVLLLRKQTSKEKIERDAARETIALGAVALLVGGISFWVAQLPLRLDLSFDRFTLPMMFGASLVLGGVWGLVRAPLWAKMGLLSLLIGLSAGFHFLTANRYRLEWEREVEFFQQLAWRAPFIQPGTAIVSPELTTFTHNSDNSLTGPLNWMYADPQPGTTVLPYDFLYAEVRANAALQDLASSGVIRDGYIFVDYQGSAETLLILIYTPPSCLRILDPQRDAYYPQLSAEVADLVHFSNLELIAAEPDLIESRVDLWSVEEQETWCFYFEKAELARQLGDWMEVAELGEKAYLLEDDANHPAEHVTFVEGYARVGDWERAVELSSLAFEINEGMRPMLCAVWADVLGGNEDKELMIAAEHVKALGCSG